MVFRACRMPRGRPHCPPRQLNYPHRITLCPHWIMAPFHRQLHPIYSFPRWRITIFHLSPTLPPLQACLQQSILRRLPLPAGRRRLIHPFHPLPTTHFHQPQALLELLVHLRCPIHPCHPWLLHPFHPRRVSRKVCLLPPWAALRTACPRFQLIFLLEIKLPCRRGWKLPETTWRSHPLPIT